MDNNLEKLSDLTLQICMVLEDAEFITLSPEEKDSLSNALDSMQFFSTNGDVERAISEGELVLKKISESQKNQ